jgi:hypothetical protein
MVFTPSNLVFVISAFASQVDTPKVREISAEQVRTVGRGEKSQSWARAPREE